MEIILLEKVIGLGNIGETVKVKPGYGRNFLIPNKKALPATKANLAKFEAMRTKLEAENKASMTIAEKMSASMEGACVKLSRQASESGMLYGTVRPRDISDSLTEQGHVVARNAINISEPIKEVGEYTIQVVLHPEVVVAVPVEVTRQSM